MTHADASSDQLFAKLFQYYKRIEPLVPEELVKGLYDAVDDKKWLEAVLSKYSDELIAPRTVAQPNITSFRYSTPANLYAVAVIVPIKFTLTLPNLCLVYKGDGKGYFGNIGAQSWGTLYYNDPHDLTNGSDFECNFFAVYANVNLIRSGNTYATYQAGGTPLAGIGGGSGNWTPC